MEEDIHKICKKYRIKNYIINDDGSIDVDGDVDLYSKGLTELPLKFNYVSGSFDCGYNKLSDLKGSPKIVGLNFNCDGNYLTNLRYSPEKVGGGFYCHRNRQLKSLEGVGEVYYMFSHILNGDMGEVNKHLLKVKLNRLKKL